VSVSIRNVGSDRVPMKVVPYRGGSYRESEVMRCGTDLYIRS
jgi:hypothetical protein